MLICLSIFDSSAFQKNNEKKKITTNLFITEFEEDRKTIVCGDGVSPMYWRFRIPDSKVALIKQSFSHEVSAQITYVGYDLDDVRSLGTDGVYTDLPVVKGLVLNLPNKIF
jgi:hypothetical protein